MISTKQDYDDSDVIIDESEFIYEKPDTHVVFHEHDDNLDTIKIDLPKLEEFFSKHLGRDITYDEAITMIDGYGLPKSDQTFQYVKNPDKIKKIFLSVSKRLNITVKDVKEEMIYDEIENNRDYYASEILFIQREIFRRFNGYWFFNNGKPTYITGWHYFFLNYWKLSNSGDNNNSAYYRDKQRRMALFYHWAFHNTKKIFKYRVSYRLDGVENIKPFNSLKLANAFKSEIFAKGGYAILDRLDYEKDNDGLRTIHGVTQPKTRREGYTAFTCCMMYCIITERQQMNAWIQALTEEDSHDKIFKQNVVEAVYQLPFFFRPFHNNDKFIKPSNEYIFNYPSRLQLLEMSGVLPESLGSVIKPFSSSYRKMDGTRAGVIIRDECGKDRNDGKSHDIDLWWKNVAKRTLEFGKRLVGFAFMGSTVGDMSGNGGASYKKLCDHSHDRTRDENGMTVTGLINLFFPAYDGMQGFIDKFGMSVIDDPKFPIMGQEGMMITEGAKPFLKNKRDALLQSGDVQGYINEIREMPWTWDEAWTPSTGDSGMPIIPMRNRYSELIFSPTETWARYRLEWIDGKKFGSVSIVEDESGQWIFVKEFLNKYPKALHNRKQWDYMNQTFIPALSVSNKIYMGVDPFQWNNKNVEGSGKRSKGAVGIFWPFDESIDRGKEGNDVFTEDFMGIFNFRTEDKESFCEEVAKACILLGIHANVETNIPVVLEEFQKWKIDGYIMYDLDNNGIEKDVRGIKADPINKNRMFNNMESFFKVNAYRVKLPQVLDCWMKIPSPESLTDHDLCAATGWGIDAVRKPINTETQSYQAPPTTIINQSF